MSALKTFAVALLVTVSGCASYYKVTDPGSGKDFYTTEVSRKLGGSAIEFKDAKTGATTTLQNSMVLEIDKKTYEAGLASAKAPAPAPAPAAAPTQQ
jgi:uncharacterized protein YceK